MLYQELYKITGFAGYFYNLYRFLYRVGITNKGLRAFIEKCVLKKKSSFIRLFQKCFLKTYFSKVDLLKNSFSKMPLKKCIFKIATSKIALLKKTLF